MTFNGRYRGLVIQNNDPDHTGRVKVYVPGINLLQIKDWNQRREEDKFFTVLGSNAQKAITRDILQTQKEHLFWAEVSLPLFGMSGPGTYHAPSDIFYIGNDSDFTFQDTNKTPEFFALDQQDFSNRESVNFTSDQSGIPPRLSINISFNNLGQKYCASANCNESGSIPSIWQPSYIDDCTNNVVRDLPKTFVPTPVSAISMPDDDSVSIINRSIVSIDLDIVNPDIFVDGQEIDKSSPFYTSCVSDTYSGDIVLNAPISYNIIDDSPINVSYSNIPFKLTSNGRQITNRSFNKHIENTQTISYKSDNIIIRVPKKNIRRISVNKNTRSYNAELLNLILPIFNTLIGFIFPRAPMAAGEPMYSRGGGGGEIYNTVTTDLLEPRQRRDMHIGGANPDSLYTNNYGRTPLNDPTNIKGRNIQSSKLQLHRGPMRSPDYNNDWKGMISIPGVGAHVWVTFDNGDVNYPIIVGTFAAQSDYKGIFEIE